MARYRVTGNWHETNSVRLANFDGDVLTITRENADLEDTRTGDVYRGGAYRVSSRGRGGRSHERARTFFGETAWSQSENDFEARVSRAYHDGYSQPL